MVMSESISNTFGTIFPKLFLGDAVSGFKAYLSANNIKLSINHILDDVELKELIEHFMYVKKYAYPLVIEDISFLTGRGQSKLLKFVEDSNLNIILLASRDNVIPTILSRMKVIHKFYLSKNLRCDFLNPSKCREELRELGDDTSDIDRLDVIKTISPVVYYNDLVYNNSAFCRGSNYKKILSLLED